MLFNIRLFSKVISLSWLNFKLQTQLIFVAVGVVSLSVSGLFYSSINFIQQEAIITEKKFALDISTLLAANIIPFLNEKNYQEIFPLCERFYKNSPNIRYVALFDKAQQKIYSVPFSFLDLKRSSFDFNPIIKDLLEYNTTKIRLVSRGNFLGFLIVGITSNQNILTSSRIIRLIILVVFLILWFTLITVTFFNALTITQPIKELSQGVKSIAAGNFAQTIDLFFAGELGDLIIQFNEMGKKLQTYDEKNIEKLMNEKTKLENLVLTIADGALLLDTNLRILLINSAAIEIFGWKKKKQLIGTNLWAHLPKPLQKKMYQGLEKIILTFSPTVFYGEFYEFSYKYSRGPKKSVRVFLRLVYDSQSTNKKPKGVAITIQDNSKEVELEQTQKRLISNISHELRTPLFNIKSFIETIREYNYSLSTRQKKDFLLTISNESNRLTRLVNNILNISKTDAKKIRLLNKVDLTKLVFEVIRSYQLVSKEKRIELVTNFNLNSPYIQGNFDFLTQVFINIVGNALKFNFEKGEILIRLYNIKSHTTPKIRVEIIDTGVGIPSSFKKTIFCRFVRVESGIHKLKGTGLGLSIVENILAEHNSQIYLVTKQKVGSIFWFDLNLLEVKK